ncbi:MAG: helix-turn-helix transcriptional regulator [Pirellulales bacterium]
MSTTPETRRLEDMLPPAITTAQAAELAGVGERTWWRWAHVGLAPPPRKVGNGPKAPVRYIRDEVLRWIAAGMPPCDEVDPDTEA